MRNRPGNQTTDWRLNAHSALFTTSKSEAILNNVTGEVVNTPTAKGLPLLLTTKRQFRFACFWTLLRQTFRISSSVVPYFFDSRSVFLRQTFRISFVRRSVGLSLRQSFGRVGPTSSSDVMFFFVRRLGISSSVVPVFIRQTNVRRYISFIGRSVGYFFIRWQRLRQLEFEFCWSTVHDLNRRLLRAVKLY